MNAYSSAGIATRRAETRPLDLAASLYFKMLLLLAPITSILLVGIQGTTPAFVLTLLSLAYLVRLDGRYGRVISFTVFFILVYSLFLGVSLFGYLFGMPQLANATVIRNIYIYGQLRQTHLTQGLYLYTALLFGFLIYQYYQSWFIKYIFLSMLLLAGYGFYEFVYYAVFQSSGDFLSNRNFGDIQMSSRAPEFLTGSLVETSNLFGRGFMRLKSLTGEPSMYALTVTPFAIYAVGMRWVKTSAFLLLSLVLSQSSSAVIGVVAGLCYLQFREKQLFILYFTTAVVVILMLYFTSETVSGAFNTLLFDKLDTASGAQRSMSMIDHLMIVFDGNIIRMLFGLGFGTVRSIDMFSNLIANVGLVGWLLYAALLLYPCFAMGEGADRRAISSALVTIFTMEMLTVSEYGYLPPWFMVALAYVRLREQRGQRRLTHQPVPAAFALSPVT